jgi:IclR family acetate operon transcriptional repressor
MSAGPGTGRPSRSRDEPAAVAPRPEAAANGAVQSVDRTLQLLEVLGSAREPLGVVALAQATCLPQATVHRLLRTLSSRGWARQDGERRYALGVALLRLGDSAARHLALRAQPFLRELAAASGETANLAVLEGDHAVYVGQAPSAHRLRTFAEVGHRVPVHSTAVGKALTAHLLEHEVAAIVRRAGLPARTATTITDPARLRAELTTVREVGYAVDDGEEAEGVCCVALPVHDGLGRAICALSVSGPSTRVDRGRAPALAATLKPIVARFRDVIVAGPAGGAEAPDRARRGLGATQRP